MRKTFRQFMATLLMAAMLSMPCYAQDGPGMSTLADNMGEQLKSTYAVDGNYAISRETGDIFYFLGNFANRQRWCIIDWK